MVAARAAGNACIDFGAYTDNRCTSRPFRAPVKVVRGLAHPLAERMLEHYEMDIGDTFFALFGAGGEEAVVDFTQPLDEPTCPRFGSRNLVNHWRDWFYTRFARLQKLAIANGGYFPSPRILQARVNRKTGVRVEIGFAPGFLRVDPMILIELPLRRHS